jgi:iron complex transport system ATP-binding protein
MSNIIKHPIDIYNLQIGYKEGKKARVLSDSINTHAKQGELIALIGPNGAGKSTFLRSICQLQPVLHGEIYLQGLNAKQLNRNQIAKQVSLVSTELQRTSRLKVIDLVGLGRFPYGNWYSGINANDIQIIKHSLEQVGMLSFADRYITELSDGEFQRVMIARALTQDTPIVVLDEPTAFLDLANKFSVVQLLWKLCREQQKTIIYSTHDINIALQYADVFWVLTQMKLHKGAPEDLLLNHTIEHLFSDHNLVFDINSSQFVKRNKFNYNVHIQGDGVAYQITKMALDRLGISSYSNKPPKLTVSISGGENDLNWIINNDVKQNYTSIYQLQSALKKLI